MSAPALSRWGPRALIGAPMLFLLSFFLLPFLVVFKISVSEMDTVFFRDVLTWADGLVTIKINFANYFGLAQDGLYLGTYIRSLGYAALTALICLLIAYPFAYCIARSPADKRPALLMMVMLPFWTRSYCAFTPGKSCWLTPECSISCCWCSVWWPNPSR